MYVWMSLIALYVNRYENFSFFRHPIHLYQILLIFIADYSTIRIYVRMLCITKIYITCTYTSQDSELTTYLHNTYVRKTGVHTDI